MLSRIKKGKSGAYSPTVRSIDFEVTQRDFDRGVDILEAFVHGTQVHNEYEGGFFPAIPEYNGESKKNAGLTERNFCGKMCSYTKKSATMKTSKDLFLCLVIRQVLWRIDFGCS